MSNKLKLGILAVLLLAGGGLLTTTSLKSTTNKKQTVSLNLIDVPVERKVTGGVTETKVKAETLEIGDDFVRLDGEVNDVSIANAINDLEKVRKSGVERIRLQIDSPGGSVFAGVKLINYIKGSPVPIDTICNGMCASMGAQIHQVGAKRLMTPNSVLMFHPASGGTQGTVEQMTNRLKMIRTFVDRLDAAIAVRSKQDYTTFKNRLANELWLQTEDAIAENFADGVVNLLGNEPVPQMLIFGKSKTSYYELEMR